MKADKRIRHPFDDPERRKWQDPEAVLSDIGVKAGFTFIDIGCGGGFFTLPVARIVGKKGRVYGLDTDTDSIASLKKQAAKERLTNLSLHVGKAEESIICENCADIVFFGLAFHDFQYQCQVLKKTRKMIKPDGQLVNLDWKKEPMELGPPLVIRFDQEMATRLIRSTGFTIKTVRDSGPYHYLIIVRP